MRQNSRSGEIAKFRSRNYTAKVDIGSGTESDVDIAARRTDFQRRLRAIDYRTVEKSRFEPCYPRYAGLFYSRTLEIL